MQASQENTSSSDPSGCVLYVASRFPVLSETFVYREVEALRAAGMRVEVATLRPAPQEPVTRTLVERFAGLVPVYGDNKTAVVSDALLEAICHPVRLAGTAAVCARDFVRGKLNIRDRLLLLVQLVAACALARRARRLQVRHLHAHMANAPTTIAMYTAMQLGTSFSFTGHANSLFARRALLAEKLRRAAFVACISEWHRKFYRDFTPVSDERSPIVRCGVDVPVAALRQGHSGTLRLVTVGRLVRKKGFNVLLDAVAILADTGTSVDVTIIGDGPERESLQTQVSALGIENAVHLVGPLSHPSTLEELSTSDVCVLPCQGDENGDRDGIPVVLMEAMACGVPVISGDLPAIRELVRNEQTGLLVVSGDAKGLAAAIARLAREPHTRDRLGSAGRARVSEEFETSVNIDRLVDAFGRVDRSLVARVVSAIPGASANRSLASTAAQNRPLGGVRRLVRRTGRGLLLSVARNTGLLDRCERAMAGSTTILTYHRVLPDDLCNNYHFPSLVMPASAFDAQMRWLAERFKVTTVQEAVRLAEAGGDPRAARVCVTFDDGYVDNHRIAAPILESHGLSATFFVIAGLTDTDAAPWFDHAARGWLAATPSQREAVLARAAEKTGVVPPAKSSLPGWMSLLKSVREPLRDELIAGLPEYSGRTVDRSDRMMTSAELRDLLNRGHEIGCHTLTHPIMTLLDNGRLEFEVERARDALHASAGKKPTGFCYPNGTLDDRVVTAVRRAGFLYACTTDPGRNNALADLLRLRRVDMNPARVTRSGVHDPLALRAAVSLARWPGMHRPPSVSVAAGTAVAYLNTEYPSISHTFIEREIREVRKRRVSIHTFSIRRPGPESSRGVLNESAARETFVILDSVWLFAASIVMAMLVSPRGACSAMLAALRLAPPGLRAAGLSLVYAAEGARLARELSRRRIRHIHVHMANNGAAVALLACRYDRRLSYSVSIHGSAEFFHVDTWTLTRKVEGAVFVRCISNFCKAQVMHWAAPASWERLHIVRCGIDPEVFRPRPLRQPGPLRLLTVGRLHPIKGYTLLMEACKQLAAEGVRFELSMVGNGPLMEALKEAICSRGLTDRVRLIGPLPQEEIQQHYDRADVMVVSSFMEGVPVVLMEAMAKELGVIATRVGGIPELVEHGVNGLLVDAGSAESLADAIRVYAANPDLCRTHGIAGRERVCSQYSIAGTAQGMLELFQKYVGIDRVNEHK